MDLRGDVRAAVYDLANAPVLYPMNCIDLSLSQQLHVDDDDVLPAGDTLSWTLGPGDARPRAGEVSRPA